MAIATVVERGSFIQAYDEKGRQITTIPAADGLQGYTASTVSVRQGSFILTYNERGQRVGTTPAR